MANIGVDFMGLRGSSTPSPYFGHGAHAVDGPPIIGPEICVI